MEFQRTCEKFDAGAWARDQQMSSLELLMDRLLTENICHPTLSNVLAPEVATWIGKSTKINVGEVLIPCPEGMRREIHGSAQ